MDTIDMSSHIDIIISIVTALFGLLGVPTLYKTWKEHRKRSILLKKLGRGPFDEAVIKRNTRYFVQPHCQNLDPAQEKEIRHALTATREDLFENIDKFIENDTPIKHLMVLADSGTGKTTFVLNYYASKVRKRRNPYRLGVVALGHRDVDQFIKDLEKEEPENTVLFLDAFDEDTRAAKDHYKRIEELMRLCEKFKRVIITCRTQFFRKDEEIPLDTGIVRFEPREAGQSRTYEFRKIYLSPFDDKNVKQYLAKRYSLLKYGARKKALSIAIKIPFLCARPMLLAHIPEVVDAKKEITHTFQLYEIMINAWYKREAYWIKKEVLENFSERLALEIWINRDLRSTERVPYDELIKLAQQWQIKHDNWHQLSVRSLLNRDADGNFKFAHRSIMEYLFVKRFLKLPPSERPQVEWTDLMKTFLLEKMECKEVEKNLHHVDLSWMDISAVELSAYDWDDVNLRGAHYKKMTFDEKATNLTLVNKKLDMKFVYIPPGTFMMGSPEDEKGRRKERETLHEVTLTQGFFMQTTQMTVGQWWQFVRETGYKSEAEKGGAKKQKSKYWDNPGFKQTDSHPVTCVSWNDVQEFIEWLNKKDEGTFSLPTEAQWQ